MSDPTPLRGRGPAGACEDLSGDDPRALARAHLDQLRAQVGGARADATLRAYAAALGALEAAAGRPVDELSDQDLAARLAVLPAGAANQLAAAVRFRGRRLVGARSAFGPLSDRQLEAQRRAAGAPSQVLGLTWEQADAMVAEAQRTAASLLERSPIQRYAQVFRLRALRDAALIAVGSDAMLRIGEAVQLNVDDVEPQAGGHALVRISRSKTDPAGRRPALLYLRPETLEAVRTWCAAGWMAQGSLLEAALFRPVVNQAADAGSCGRRLSTSAARRVVQHWARKVGIEGRVSGHSLRVGAAQSLVERGATVVELQQAGRWTSSDMPAYYARGQAAARGAVARLRGGADQRFERRRGSV